MLDVCLFLASTKPWCFELTLVFRTPLSCSVKDGYPVYPYSSAAQSRDTNQSQQPVLASAVQVTPGYVERWQLKSHLHVLNTAVT